MMFKVFVNLVQYSLFSLCVQHLVMFQQEFDDTLLLKHLFYIAPCTFCDHFILLDAEGDKLKFRQLFVVCHNFLLCLSCHNHPVLVQIFRRDVGSV